MNLFSKLVKRPRTFQKISGLTIFQFNNIFQRLKRAWKKKIIRKKVKSGRPYGIKDLKNQLLYLLLYYRTYTTQHFLSCWFPVAETTVCRTIKRLEQLLVKILSRKKQRNLAESELNTILVDCTEQKLQRPSKNQKKYYSGKRNQHTLKTEIQINGVGLILKTSPPYPGSIHDYTIRQSELAIPKKATLLVDKGYQGLQKIRSNLQLPIKKPKGKTLNKEQKAYNKKLAKERIMIEHKIRQIKIFRILKEEYRDTIVAYALKMIMVTGLVNWKSGF